MSFQNLRTKSPLALETWFWLLGAPVSVVASLMTARNVFLVFAVYHLGFCLVLPAVRNILGRRFSVSDHLESLGLTGPGTVRGLVLGLGIGVVLAGGIIFLFRLFGGAFLGDHNVPEVLNRWGADQADMSLMFWFMTLVNGPAEELYWRGFVHAEMSDRRPRMAAILVAAACYASYHGMTVFLLVANLSVALLFMATIFLAGWGWGWLRERTGSVWPPLLGHAGASIGYMIMARPLLDL